MHLLIQAQAVDELEELLTLMTREKPAVRRELTPEVAAEVGGDLTYV